ncbi:MAG: glycosyltransferase [Luteitalea sp.]|nr:glycosyltransferase [Luteitalea sp.]
MRLAIISHKRCWRPSDGGTSFTTDGGFPFQVRAIAELFDETVLLVPCTSGPSAPGLTALQGRHLSVAPLTEPDGHDLRRKIGFPLWLLRNGLHLVRQAKRADVLHTPVPGDIGLMGMLIGLILRKPLFVRHCGNWLQQATAAERLCKWLMERVVGGRHVMFATGGGTEQPSDQNPRIQWIFSSTLTEAELDALDTERRPPTGGRLRLITAGRQEREKGTGVTIESLPLLLKQRPLVTLDVLGDGMHLQEFKELARTLQVSDRVRFHGNVSHATLLEQFRAADLFCFPTRASEGFPKVVIEAMACGLPVVTSQVSVLPSLTRECGIALGDLSVASVTAAVLQCVAEPETYSRMSGRARQTAREYSLERWRDTIGGSLRSVWGPLRSGV